MGGKRPDITPAQLVAALTWVVAQAVAFGWLDTQRSQVILSVGATVIAAAWKIADSVIRNGRNRPTSAPPPSA
jgi:hypothetical protein